MLRAPLRQHPGLDATQVVLVADTLKPLGKREVEKLALRRRLAGHNSMCVVENR
jgi:hypothetical protein